MWLWTKVQMWSFEEPANPTNSTHGNKINGTQQDRTVVRTLFLLSSEFSFVRWWPLHFKPENGSSAEWGLHYLPFWQPLLVVYSNSSIESALLQYCPAANAKCFKYYKTAKNLPSVHTAQKNKNQMKPVCPAFVYHMSQTWVVSLPPVPRPLRKTSNIYIF